MKFDLNKAADTQFRKQGKRSTFKDPVTPSNRQAATLKYSSAGKSTGEKFKQIGTPERAVEHEDDSLERESILISSDDLSPEKVEI